MVFIPKRRGSHSFGFSEILSAFPIENLVDSQFLSGELIESVCAKHRCLFGGIYHTAFVIWAMLGQVLRDGKEVGCRSAITRIQDVLRGRGFWTPSNDTGNYCRARAKLKASAIRELCIRGAQAVKACDFSWSRWKQRNVLLVDGFTVRMPDSPKNRLAYPHHKAQKPGIGFPIARCIGIFNYANGCVVDSALGAYLGKETGETALLRKVLSSISPESILVADRHYCSYWQISSCITLGIHICFRKHQGKKTDFRRGERLGKEDHIVIWTRPKKPTWMSTEEYETYPERLHLREIRYVADAPGRKQTPFVIVTSLLETTGDEGATREEIAELYGFRWQAEICQAEYAGRDRLYLLAA